MNTQKHYFIIVVLSICVCAVGDMRASTDQPGKVLVLNSYHPGFTWSDNIMQGIRQVFENTDVEAELIIEYMDTKNHNPAEIFPLLEELFVVKYQNIQFEAIIVSDNNGSVILNEPESFYYRYKTLLWTILAFVCLQAFVIILVAINVVRRRMAEKSLLQEQNLLHALMDNIPERIYFKDTESRFIRVNKALAKRHGLSDPAETLGKTDFDFFTEEHAQQAYKDEQEVIKTGQPLVGLEEKETWWDGQETWASSTKVPFRDENGRIVGVIGISRDITARKQAEEEQRRFWGRIQRQHAALVRLTTHPALIEGSLKEALRAIAESVAETLNVDYVHIFKLSLDGRELLCIEAFDRSSKSSLESSILSVDQYPCFFAALKAGQIVDASDVRTDSRTVELITTCWEPQGINASLNAPIRLHGEVVGSVRYDYMESQRIWTPDEINFAGQIANLVAQVFLSTDLRRRADQMAAITRISHEITALSNLQQVYHSIARYAAELSHSDASGVFALRSDSRLYVEFGYGVQNELIEAINAQGIPLGHGAIGRATIERCPVQVPNTLTEPNYPYRSLAEMERIRSVLAVPMIRGEEVIGGIVLWHRQTHYFSPQEVDFIGALAQECVNAVENARLFEAEARRRRETETLWKATQALISTLDLQSVFEVILSELRQVVPYDSASVQQLNGNQLEIIGGHGFSNLKELLGVCFDLTANDNPNREVVRTKTPVILDDAPTAYEEFHREPHVQADIHSWLGVPLLFRNQMIGMIALDKREPGFYTREHARLALAFANQAAIAIGHAQMFAELKQAEEALRQMNEELEQRVEMRTQELLDANNALQMYLETLKKAQEQLVQTEKMAALGRLVAGVTHEINTPIGIGVTAASHLKEKTQEIENFYREAEMKRSDLEKYLQVAGDSTEMILKNLQRAVQHIQSFKRMAVDQISEEKRRFNVKQYVDEVLLSLHPKLKHTKHTVTVTCPEDLELNSYPGILSQIVTNLIVNSLVHGFENKPQGEILLDFARVNGALRIQYSDNGKGMNAEVRSRIFEPFYTTKRDQGGSGLGLHIVYNLVTQTLGGNIECESTPGSGTTFIIQVPMG